MDRSRGLASRLFAAASLGSCGIHGQLYLQTGFWQEGEAWFRTRFPTESTETLAHGFFTKPKPAGNPTIAHLLGFETENGAVSFMKFLVPGRTGGRPSSRARECAQSHIHFVPPQCPPRTRRLSSTNSELPATPLSVYCP
jgi:hypothetical protein